MIRPGPPAVPGMRIGLLGGSFDPPHAGHVHISLQALRMFRLDRVWWLLSPGNPLKPDAPAQLAARMSRARELIAHPRIVVTDIENRLGTRYTAATLGALLPRYCGVHFVWLMGADNLASFHRWDRWADIMAMVPVGVLARPSHQVRAGLSPAARRFARFRLDPRQAGALALADPPRWALVNGPMLDVSSTDLRAAGRWSHEPDPRATPD